VIRAVAKTAINAHGTEVIGFLDGYHGLVFNRHVILHYDDVSNILSKGGTILGMARREKLFRMSGDARATAGTDHTSRARRVFKEHGLSALVCVGGEGTLAVAAHLDASGIPAVGVPKTIDNDVPFTDQTFGFDTSLAVAAEAVDRLRSTAESHHRVMVLEVMGRHAGWIALHAGLAGGGDIVLIPEIPFSWGAVCAVVERRARRGRRFSLIVAAEGAHPRDGQESRAGGRADGLNRARLGGVGNLVAGEVERRTRLESRATVLGYLQRGGEPTPFDRVLATRYGHAAASLAAEGTTGVMVAFRSGDITTVPLERLARGRPRLVPPDSPLLAAARAVGTSFGDQ